MQNWFVVVMGLVTVFVVLILIIGLCWLLGLACRGSSKKEEMQAAAAAAPAQESSIPTAPEFLAAVSAAIAEAAVRMRLQFAFFPSRSCKNILRKVNKKYEKVSCERQRLPL